MSKKITIAISILLFIALAALIICEKKWPEGGSALMAQLLG